MSIRRLLIRALQVFAVLLVLLYIADLVTLHTRIAHGTAFQTIQVHEFLNTPLKGQKEEYDYVGDYPVTCSNSLFPQAGNNPCWWVTRHTTVWQ